MIELSVTQEYMILLPGFLGFFSAIYIWFVMVAWVDKNYMVPATITPDHAGSAPVGVLMRLVTEDFIIQRMAANYALPRRSTYNYTLDRTKAVVEDLLLDSLREFITIETEYDEFLHQEIMVARINLAVRR